MHLSELFGRTIKVNLARPLKGGGPTGRGPEKAIWADEEWIQKNVLGDEQTTQVDQDGAEVSSGSRPIVGPPRS